MAQGGPRAQGLQGRSSPPSANRAGSGSGCGGSVEWELEWLA